MSHTGLGFNPGEFQFAVLLTSGKNTHHKVSGGLKKKKDIKYLLALSLADSKCSGMVVNKNKAKSSCGLSFFSMCYVILLRFM